MSRHRHDMPYGAALQPDGSTRFRLWAPGQQAISVVIDGGADLPLQHVGEGWFELTTRVARTGSRYAYRLADGLLVPDPASRQQAEDVHGPSLVVDPEAYFWRTTDWKGRPWNEAVLYELHVGTFMTGGEFAGVLDKLDWLKQLGITAIELMPIADFKGGRGWGYDGVLPFAPHGAYGTPYRLKTLIDAAHERELMVFLDVVYNHFGPEGNYLSLYAPQFFTDRHQTPWGAAIDFSNPAVRSFFIHNALYWLNEFRFDGLRFDAVHAIKDDSATHILGDVATSVRRLCGADRHVHLVLENDANQASFLRRKPEHLYDAQWNDDFHHASHVLLTRESGGYYSDYTEQPLAALGRALAEGFIYQGEASGHRGGAERGETSRDLPLSAFVAFLQNHDQIGNRALGERLSQMIPTETLRALQTILLLAPHIPLLFMGEEWNAQEPFLFFCDFDGDLATAVREGRRCEFAKFPAFSDEAMRARIPDPNDVATFERSKLDWNRIVAPEHAGHLAFIAALLDLRRREIMPRLDAEVAEAQYQVSAPSLLQVSWKLADGATLSLQANLGDAPVEKVPTPESRLIYATDSEPDGTTAMPAWSVRWHLTESRGSP